jgi:DNA polymerase III alpha subunit
MEGYNEWIEEKCDEVGMTAEDKEYLHEAIAGFAEYTFNRAHATVYGITAYRCAYLAARHPLEFHAALLAVAAGEDKEPQYLRTTRRRGIRVTNPHVNISGATYTVDGERGVIRKGLRSVDGVGAVSAEVLVANAPYRDLDDLVERSPARPISGGKSYDGSPDSLTGVLGKLRDGGALSGL